MPLGWEIMKFIPGLYLQDFYVLNDFVHFVVILVLRREQECSCHGKLTDTRRFSCPSLLFFCIQRCSPIVWGRGTKLVFCY